MRTVMVVDDAMFMRNTLKMMLEKNGYEVVGEADNGVNAVKKYHELKPDIVTMDITMPIMGGIEAIKEIKQENKDACIVVISSMGQDRFVKDAIMAGAKSFILKPFKEQFVMETLRKISKKEF